MYDVNKTSKTLVCFEILVDKRQLILDVVSGAALDQCVRCLVCFVRFKSTTSTIEVSNESSCSYNLLHSLDEWLCFWDVGKVRRLEPTSFDHVQLK
ncbi:hypothetical protein D3C73_1328110 [compost metagenome]